MKTDAPKSDWLKAELWQALALALELPTSAQLEPLYQALEHLMSGKPLALQLQIAGTVLLQLSEIYVARFDQSVAEWESQYQPLEPVVSLESCVDLFVQSLSLNLSELFEAPVGVQYPAQRKQAAEGSSAAEVDKETLLHLADQAEQSRAGESASLSEADLAAQIQELAHDENVEQWSARIEGFLRSSPSNSSRLLEMQHQLGMPLIELWLGLLLGGYGLEQRGDFYDARSIWIASSIQQHLS